VLDRTSWQRNSPVCEDNYVDRITAATLVVSWDYIYYAVEHTKEQQ